MSSIPPVSTTSTAFTSSDAFKPQTFQEYADTLWLLTQKINPSQAGLSMAVIANAINNLCNYVKTSGYVTGTNQAVDNIMKVINSSFPPGGANTLNTICTELATPTLNPLMYAAYMNTLESNRDTLTSDLSVLNGNTAATGFWVKSPQFATLQDLQSKLGQLSGNTPDYSGIAKDIDTLVTASPPPTTDPYADAVILFLTTPMPLFDQGTVLPTSLSQLAQSYSGDPADFTTNMQDMGHALLTVVNACISEDGG